MGIAFSRFFFSPHALFLRCYKNEDTLSQNYHVKKISIPFYLIYFVADYYFCDGNYLAEAACVTKLATLFASLTRRQKDFNGRA
jgi:hypothetical protein